MVVLFKGIYQQAGGDVDQNLYLGVMQIVQIEQMCQRLLI